MTIGERIKNRRMQLGMSVDDLAAELGKNRATVYRYENDEIKEMPTTVLEPLAKILKTTPADLMGWSDGDDEPLSYYLNPETAMIAQMLFENPEYHVLFDAAQGSSPENLLLAADLLRRLKGTNRDG